MGLLTMSDQELTRLDVVQRVLEQRLSQRVCGEFQICRIDPSGFQVLSRLCCSLRWPDARPGHAVCPSHRHVVKLLRPGGARAVVAESLLLKHQLLILNRSRARAPNLRPSDRVIAGLCAGLMRSLHPAKPLGSAMSARAR